MLSAASNPGTYRVAGDGTPVLGGGRTMSLREPSAAATGCATAARSSGEPPASRHCADASVSAMSASTSRLNRHNHACRQGFQGYGFRAHHHACARHPGHNVRLALYSSFEFACRARMLMLCLLQEQHSGCVTGVQTAFVPVQGCIAAQGDREQVRQQLPVRRAGAGRLGKACRAAHPDIQQQYPGSSAA